MYAKIIENAKKDARNYLETNYLNLTFNPELDDLGAVLALLDNAAVLGELEMFQRLAEYIFEFKEFEDDLEARYYYSAAYAVNYRELHLFEQALPYYIQANKISYMLNDSELIAASLLSLASLYLYIKDFETALHYADLSLNEAQKSKNTIRVGNVYSIIGVIYIRSEYPEKAIESNLKAFEYYQQNDNYMGIRNYIILLINLGVSYRMINELDSAKKYLFEAMELSKKYRYKDLIVEVEKSLIRVYKMLNEWEKACNSYQVFVESLQNKKEKGEVFQKSHHKGVLKSNIVSMSSIKEKNDELTKKIDALYDEFHHLANISTKKLQVIDEVKDALKRGDIIPYFQGKWYTNEKMLNGAEALVRMRKTDGSIVSPYYFIEEIENHDIINEVSRIMIKESVNLCKKKISEGYDDFVVSINLSPYQLKRPVILPFLEEEIKKSGIKPENIEIEITERALIEKNPIAINSINRIKQSKIGLALDDFGAGFSSLSSLKDYPFDVIKIDRSLVYELPEDKKALKVLSSLIQMLKNMEFQVVAEGVENNEQVGIIENYGCDIIQGYYYSRPIPYDDFIK